MLKCTFGVAPGMLMVLPMNLVMTAVPNVNIMDNKPRMNILPFGMCQSPANPMVVAAAATVAALGALTPMPCIPMALAPWMPGASTVTLANMPALNNSSKLMCMWGGVIGIDVLGQFTVSVP